MAVSYLPEQITKDILFEKAQERFQEWVKIYADPTKTAQSMYEDMSCSCYCGCPADDFPDDFKAEQDSVIRYQYKDGMCFFVVDDIEVEVLDLREMRKASGFGFERYADICTPAISYVDPDGNYIYHIIPDIWLYGSTSVDFDEGKPVHTTFIDAARKYIEEHNITKEMQEVQA